MLWLFLIGFFASVFGSMVGLSGGFIMAPVLRLFFGFSPAAAAGTSLALVIANGASSSTSYLLQRRVHVRTGWMIAVGGIPGSILGAIAVKHAPARLFDWLFAVFLILVSADILANRRPRVEEAATTIMTKPASTLVMGFGVGFVSSLFGVGGGVILVPSLMYFTALPAHVISATSQFAILLTSPVGFITHAIQHDVAWKDAIPLVAAGLLGGPVGARLTARLQSRPLMLCVAAALTIAAVALVYRHIIG
jgi:uncharacterized membrane protein YfcA